MNADTHLRALQVEEAAEGETTPEIRLHLAHCAVCRARIARAMKLEHVLRAIPRVESAPDLVPRIRAAVAESGATSRLRPHAYAIGIAAALSALFALALVYQAGIELQVGGALNFFSFYVRQPEAVINYPGDALAALVEVLPLAQIMMTLAVMVVAVVLARRFQAAIDVTPARGSNHHA
jgi:hypothetical protein